MTATQSKLAGALAKAQAEMHNAPLNKVNPHFKSKYADLAAIRDAVIPALAKNGLAVVQLPAITEHGFVLITRLMHESGEVVEATYPLPANGTPQATGSALTYAKRYSLASLCGIAAEEDDDANAAEADPKARPVEAKSKADSRETYERLSKANRAKENIEDFNKFWKTPSVLDALAGMPDDWRRNMEAERDDKAVELEERAAMANDFPGDLSAAANLMSAG